LKILRTNMTKQIMSSIKRCLFAPLLQMRFPKPHSTKVDHMRNLLSCRSRTRYTISKQGMKFTWKVKWWGPRISSMKFTRRLKWWGHMSEHQVDYFAHLRHRVKSETYTLQSCGAIWSLWYTNKQDVNLFIVTGFYLRVCNPPVKRQNFHTLLFWSGSISRLESTWQISTTLLKQESRKSLSK